jgi:hypothetical protein
METMILALYEIDMGRGLVLTANIGFHPRMALLRILAGERVHMAAAQAEELTGSTGILNRIEAGYGDRNAIVHGLWSSTDAPGVIRRMSIRARGKKLQAKAQNYKAQDLWAISERLSALLTDFTDLGDRLGVVGLLETAPRHSGAPRPNSASK